MADDVDPPAVGDEEELADEEVEDDPVDPSNDDNEQTVVARHLPQLQAKAATVNTQAGLKKTGIGRWFARKPEPEVEAAPRAPQPKVKNGRGGKINFKTVGVVVLILVMALIALAAIGGGGSVKVTGTPGGSINLPSLLPAQVGEPWKVPQTGLQILRNPNQYASWLMAGILIIVFLWYAKKESAIEPEDFEWIRIALVVFLVLTIFAKEIVSGLNTFFGWFELRITQLPSPDIFVALCAVGVVVVGIYRAIQGERDLSRAAVAAGSVGMILTWAPHPGSDLRLVGLLGIAVSMGFMAWESILRDPRDRTKRLWMFPAALVGAIVLVASRTWIFSGLSGVVTWGISQVKAAWLQMLLVSAGLPLAAILSTAGAVVLGGFVSTTWGKKALKWAAEHTAPGKTVPDYDSNDGGLLMLLFVWIFWIVFGGI